MYLRLLYESFNFAWQALKSNVLRTILSLLGVTVGIFAIIAAYTVADAMTRSINDSLSFLGEKVIYVQKWPWVFDANFPWWKYFNRPSPKYAEYKYLEKNLVNQAGTSIFDSKGGLTLKSKNNSIEDIAALGVSYAYNVVTEIPIENGRYFVPQETESGKHVALIGYEIANTLFPNINPIGQTFKIRGIPFVVIATLKKQGSGLIGGPDFDKATFIPYDAFSRMFQSRYSDPTIAVKGLPDDEGLLELEAEMRGIMRGKRGLKPSEDDSFSLNRPEMAASVVASISDVLNGAAFWIGIFSIAIGGFGIANIMFVSVKERTNIIGIQKALGAKNNFILFQFLFEAVFLSILGGAIGLFLVWLITIIPQESLVMTLNAKNIAKGIGICTAIGLISGIIPAYSAARLDPVIAIRSK